MQRQTIYGVDFSGAANAGKKIWVCQADPSGAQLRVVRLDRAANLPGGAVARSAAMAALRALICTAGAAVVALDAPPSLHRSLMPTGWLAFVQQFQHRFPSPEAFREWCTAQSQLLHGRPEIRRLTDIHTHTPFAANNLRLYRQTYTAINDLITPLVLAGQACVLPLQVPRPDIPWIVEICPAASLKALHMYCSYKGRTTERTNARARLLDQLRDRFPLDLPAEIAAACLNDSEGDAIDSLIAACTAFQTLHSPQGFQVDHPAASEGWVYTSLPNPT
jgi:hypothetical protein